MFPKSSQALFLLNKHPDILSIINRGIERECMRITSSGLIAQTKHPYKLGSSLTHKFITTDFSEALLEFITPVISDVNNLLTTLRDIHRYVAKNINKELIWPFSMPCFINKSSDIQIAQYGNSYLGQIKNIYRRGLKNRYGSLMQSIAGVHYNFSLPLSFWYQWSKINKSYNIKKVISHSYLNLIRNYYRFGWIVTYLFGASPALCSSFLRNNNFFKNKEILKNKQNTLYMPYATSLRLSNLGYKNKLKKNIFINFNNLNDYVKTLKNAINTPSIEFSKIGLKNNLGEYLQLNKNFLQIENELYTYVRPKRNILPGESFLDSLYNKGIEYIELRSLDVNPFSPIGINKTQILFLDIFLIWCLVSESPKMNNNEIEINDKNWNKIILKGRKPGNKIILNLGGKKITFKEISKQIFSDLIYIAKILDKNTRKKNYQIICKKLEKYIDYPELTYSAKMLKQIWRYRNINDYGLSLAINNKFLLIKESLEFLDQKSFIKEMILSYLKQKKIEKNKKIIL